MHGVGYELEAPMSTFYDLPDVGREVSLFTHYAQKEDSVSLYGFLREAERRLFRDVQKVSGIGAKIALAVLSGVPVDEFARLVQAGDVTALTRIPGIGKKTAERMVVELRDRAADLAGAGATLSGAGGRRRPAERSDHRPAAAGLQTGRGRAHGARGHRGRRRRSHHHPQSAKVRASLTPRRLLPPRATRLHVLLRTSIRSAPPTARSTATAKQGLRGLVIGAIGVVFGDIGTSPLYTLKEAFSPHFGLVGNHDTVLGILSLVFWALMIVVTLKYVTIIMRADNEGEGGIMALMTLAQRTLPKGSRSAYIVGILGIFGASLFFGDSVITPAITVLGAVEGLEVAAPGLHRFIVPIAVVILVMVFLAQRFGTEKVGRVFGPITVLWFLALAAIGIHNIVRYAGSAQGAEPDVGRALLHRARLALGADPGRGGAGGDRRRGAVRRHGPFRRQAHPLRAGTRWCCRA